jgi:hypothetical protein
VFLSFQRKEEVNLVELGLKEKMDVYRERFMEDCRAQILLDAEIYVDSIISIQLNPPGIDTTLAPPKPNRPDRPYDTLILDSIDLRPIISDSLD